MTKAAAWILTAAFALLPAWALAEEAKPAPSKAVQLSDAELDKVVAGASTLLILNNPGNANVSQSGSKHFGCINACGSPTETGVTGFIFVIPPSSTPFAICPGVGRCF